MDENMPLWDPGIQECLAGFGSLWSRVTGSTPPDYVPAEEDLKHLITQEQQLAAGYRPLTRCFSGCSCALADSRRREKRLQAEYFIHTGERYSSGVEPRPATDRLTALRKQYQNETSLSAAYEIAKERTQCPELESLYQVFASQTRERAKALRALLLSCF